MMNKQDFTKIASRILHPKPKLSGTKPIYPMREWFIGLIVAIIIVGASGAWSAQTYLKYKNTTVGEVGELDSGTVVYRESLVEAALEQFSIRQAKLDTLLNNTVPVVPEVNPAATASSTAEEVLSNESQDTATSSADAPDEVVTELSTTTEESASAEELPEEEESPEEAPVLSN